MKLITINHYQVHTTDDTESHWSQVKVSKRWPQKSVNVIAPGSLKGFQPKLTQTFLIVGP